MANAILNKVDFDKWANESWQQYACCTNYAGYYLTLKVSIAGEYVVTCNHIIVYKGRDLQTALIRYNQRI